MSQTSYASKRLDHHGIVAGVCKDFKIAELIDQKISAGPCKKVSYGEATVAMIINMLGFTSRPLYLTAEFFKNKPNGLIRDDLEWSELNDDCLGRTLDKLYESGVTEIFSELASSALHALNIDVKYAHLDSSSFSLTGEYKVSEEDDRQAMKITRGYSKDHRPDLKQACLSMICEHSSNIPIWMEALDGNQSDVKSFSETISRFCSQMRESKTPIMVMDAAFYSKANLHEHREQSWVTRAPEKIKELQHHYSELRDDDEGWVQGDQLRYHVSTTHYGGVEQRWITVESLSKKTRDHQALQRKVDAEYRKVSATLKKLSKQDFACEKDADLALDQLAETLKFHDLDEVEIIEHKKYKDAGRPTSSSSFNSTWHPHAVPVINDDFICDAQQGLGRYTIATNCLNDELSPDQLIALYKSQGVTVERGFRFLKDPMFFADSIFLKNPSRIMALMMVMTLSLLIYSIAEYQLRESLHKRGETIPNQSGKPTTKPTMRRIFQLFEGIEILQIKTPTGEEKIVMNLDEIRTKLIGLMSDEIKLQYLQN